MEAIQNGDAGALKIFVQRHRKLLKHAILRTVHDDAAAEDVLQDCLLDLWRNSRHYCAGKGTPLAWMCTLCRRRAIDHLRRSMSYHRAVDRMGESLKDAVAISYHGNDTEDTDMSRVLTQHLTLLPAPQAEALRLAFLQGMSQREVAAATQTPLGTVKTRIELGLRKLRQALRTHSDIHTLQAA